MIRYREINHNFCDIWRVFLTGCSSAGKTYFTQQLLEQNMLKYSRVYYCHPDLCEDNPIDWNIPVIFSVGLPDLEDIMKFPEYSCIILDDLFHEAKDSKVVDYLFRVLSRKRKLHVIIMSQRYFSNGLYSLNIRNSSNYHVLMRNADEGTNIRAAKSMNLTREIQKANELTAKELYPYFFIDKTNQARVTGLQVFIDIFSRYNKIVMKSGLWYCISEKDFDRTFTKIDDQTAIVNENTKQENNSPEIGTGEETSEIKQESDKSNDPNQSESDKQTERNNFDRRVKQVIRRYQKRAKFQR